MSDEDSRLGRSALVTAISGHTGQPRRVVEQVLDGFGDVLAAALAAGDRVVLRDMFSVQRDGTGAAFSLGKRLAAVTAGEQPPPVIRTGMADSRERAQRVAAERRLALAGA